MDKFLQVFACMHAVSAHCIFKITKPAGGEKRLY